VSKIHTYGINTHKNTGTFVVSSEIKHCVSHRRAGEMLSMTWPGPSAQALVPPSDTPKDTDVLSSPWPPSPSDTRRTSLVSAALFPCHQSQDHTLNDGSKIVKDNSTLSVTVYCCFLHPLLHVMFAGILMPGKVVGGWNSKSIWVFALQYRVV
jgi:hypothetical protein